MEVVLCIMNTISKIPKLFFHYFFGNNAMFVGNFY